MERVSIRLLAKLRRPCRDVGEVIPVASLRPLWTARETVGGRPDPRTPIMRRLCADRGDNPDPGTPWDKLNQVDERHAIRHGDNPDPGILGQTKST